MGVLKEIVNQKTGGRGKKGNTLHLIHIALIQILNHTLQILILIQILNLILNQILYLQVLPVMEGGTERGEG